MAKIARVAQKQFGSTGSGGDFGKFGSKFAGSAVYTQDPATIQALSNFTDGWASAVVSGSVPELEDMNSLFLLIFYQLAYLFQAGIFKMVGASFLSKRVAFSVAPTPGVKGSPG